MLLAKLLDIGIDYSIPESEKRYIRNTNLISLLVFLANIIVSSFLYFNFGFYPGTVIIFVMAWVFLLVPFFSYLGQHTTARLALALLIPLISFYISYLIRKETPEFVNEYTFFNIRVILLGTVVIPIVVFPGRQKGWLILGMLLPGLMIWFFDPINEWLGVEYERYLGEPKFGYSLTNLYFMVTYSFIVIALLIFKFNNETLLNRNLELLNALQDSNRQLGGANDIIRQQAVELKRHNEELLREVESRTRELKQANEELVRHNSELRQFSNTLSHNLRSPVANLLGLTRLFELEKDEQARAELIGHIKSSAESLDHVLKDMSKVMDIRNHQYQIKENVSLSEEWESVKTILADKISACRADIKVDFAYDSVYCIRSYINSIFYNLLSNALKYRDPQRPCRIRVSSRQEGDKVIIEVQDNGIGIDLKRHGDKLFGMYKRFHDHTDGKGLGLFLAKQQVEALEGVIEVDSEVGRGTRFIMTFPRSPREEIAEQIYYESDVATIWFDAINFISTLVWKRKPTSEEYREVLQRNLDIFRSYKCYGCLADVRKLGIVPKEDRLWFVKNILSEAPEIGVQKVVIVHDRDDGKDDAYFEEMRKECERHGVRFEHNNYTLEQARRAIRGMPVV